MTLGSRLDVQLDRIKRSLWQSHQTFTRTDNARALPDLPVELPRTYTHGTRSGYGQGCRCVGCVSAMRSQVENRRQARALAGLCRDCGLRPPMISSTRCDECRMRHNTRSRDSYRRGRRRKYFATATRARNFGPQPSLFSQSAEGR